MRRIVSLLVVGLLTGCARFERAHDAAVDPSVQAGIEAQLAAREYRASENGQGLQAPNRAHNLRTYFDASGIRVVDRTAAGSPELLELSLAGVGRGSELSSVPAGTVHADESRVEIRRPNLVEWFVNGPDGLEQGFTLAERPAGEGKLVLELRLDGAKARSRGEELVVETATRRKLSYGKLAAWDAHGAPLAAELQLADAGRIALSIDDAGAQYPITIDPLLSETPDAVIEGNQANTGLGLSVASAGDVNGDGYADVIVGALRYDNGEPDEGAAFVFHGSASGIPDAGVLSAQAQLESDQAGGSLGSSVASAGDVNGDGFADVIVGAYRYDDLENAGQTDEGAAFVFLGSASGVADGNPTTAHAKLESDQLGALLGQSVASAGDVNGDGFADVIVGAPAYDSPTTDEGAAFVFLGSASGVADGSPTTAHAQLESDRASAQLGSSVASAGDVNGDGFADVIVGAPFWEDGSPFQADEGAAFLFLGSASGLTDGNPATAHAQLEGNQGNARMGNSVAGAGDVNGDGYADVIVGAYLYDQGQTDEGSAFIFHGSAAGVADGSPGSADSNIDGDAEDHLGYAVASAGDVNGDGYADVIVGAMLHGPIGDGAAFVYLGSAGGVGTFISPANADVQLPNDEVWSVASAGDVNGDGYADVIVGAIAYSNGELSEGAAFLYHGGAIGIVDAGSADAASRFQSNQAGAELGYSVASAGDVNGDGYGDVIVGARLYDSGSANEGAAFIFHGGHSGIPDANPLSANTLLQSNKLNANLGQSVASAGDVNGDGYDDVIVGTPYYEDHVPPGPEAGEGAAFVFLGSASGVADGNPLTAHAQLESNQQAASFGYSVASAGDVNGDGYGDVIVGAYGYDAPQSGEGAAFIFHGSATGLSDGNPTTADAQLESDQVNALLGFSVASAGDVNGDGYADVIVGAFAYTSGDPSEGAAFVFLGSAGGVADGNPVNAHAQLESNRANASWGFSVASAGDVNGDAFADVIVGAPSWANGQSSEGAAFVFHGSASGVADGSPATAHAQAESNQAGAELGVSVASAGDVNGDGYADVIIGADTFDNGHTNEGAAFVFLGSANGVVIGGPSSVAQLQGDFGGALSGMSVASAGDVDGDGFADVIVGAPGYDSPETNEGAAFVYQSNGNQNGRPVLARQKRGDGSGIPVPPWGRSHFGAGFAAELRATHPQVRGRVKAQFQACPREVPMGDASCTTATTPTWVAVNGTTPEVVISHTFSSLATGELVRWRARVLYAPASGPLPANPMHSPWRRPGAQSAEADIRVVPEPGLVLSLASGVALLTALARRRRRA